MILESQRLPYLGYESSAIREWQDKGYPLKALERRDSALAEVDARYQDEMDLADSAATVAAVLREGQRSSGATNRWVGDLLLAIRAWFDYRCQRDSATGEGRILLGDDATVEASCEQERFRSPPPSPEE